jgi:murein L,D-transpeptidase YcbB/YkuD
MNPDRHRLATAFLATALAAWALASPTSTGRPPARVAPVAVTDTVAALLRAQLAGSRAAELLSPALVRRFYARRGYLPVWSRDSEIAPATRALVHALGEAGAEGLRPESYRLTRIEAVLERLHTSLRGGRLGPQDRAALDLLLSDAYLTYGTHLARGQVEPRTIHSGWSIESRSVDVVASLEGALAPGRVEVALAALAPQTPEYAALRAALARYRGIAARGGWPLLPAGLALRAGARGDAVVRLRTRLASEVRLAPADSPAVYGTSLTEAVRVFQRTHGLRDDGVVGPATRASLNFGAGRRVEQIELSMERLRWLPDDLSRRYIRVSIPAFELAAMEDGRTALTMRVVGGRPDWRTPIFSARMTSVVLSPYWNIPPGIAEAEVLPKARRDPGYLSRNGIRWVRDGSGYRLRQDPGPLNPLGGVKFLFPNPYDTYLHDTPSKNLFAEPERAYSHGCMRVERPLELAEYVLGEQGWSREEILAGMTRGVERTVPLEDPIPVHVLYRTAWVDTAGRVQFRDDLYGHDRRLREALAGKVGSAGERESGECTLAAGPGRVEGGEGAR